MRAYWAGIITIIMTITLGCSPAPEPVTAPAPAQPTPVQPKPEPVAAEEPMDEHAHTHIAPHGGTLVMLGDHVANVELVLNPLIGTLTAYVLDGEAENAIQVSTPGLPIIVILESQEPQTLTLMPAENVLTGETRESTSQFTGQFDALKGATAFKGSFPEITIHGVTMKNIGFEFP